MCAVHDDGRVPAVSSSGRLILDWPEALTKQRDLEELEHALCTSPDEASIQQQLQVAIDALRIAYKAVITRRTDDSALLKLAADAIRVGNVGFRRVYTSVWEMIVRAEAKGIKRFLAELHQRSLHFSGLWKAPSLCDMLRAYMSFYANDAAEEALPFYERPTARPVWPKSCKSVVISNW